MAHRPRRFWPHVLVTTSLVLIAHGGAAQQPAPPLAPLPAPPAAAPKSAEAEPVKLPSKQEVNEAIEIFFGRDSAEARRPVRVWLPNIGMAIVAKEANLGRDGRSVRFVDVSVGFPNEAKTVHGAEGVVVVDQAIMEIGQLSARTVISAELQNKNGSVILTPQGSVGSVTTFIFEQTATSGLILSAPMPPQAPAPPAAMPQPPLARTRTVVISNSLDVRFKFKIDPQAPLADLLPPPAKMSAKTPLPFNEDLTKVAEISFGEPVAKDTAKHQAMEATAHEIAKINHFNLKKNDGFMIAMIEKRSDLRGMPFLMGDECRTSEEQAKIFATVAEAVHNALRSMKENEKSSGGVSAAALALDSKILAIPRTNQEMFNRNLVAALAQIFMPEAASIRVGLAKSLATIPHIDATKALARLAIFSAEDEVRAAAIEGLKLRRERDYTDILMQGFHYPLPAVAKRSAEALVKLERKDVLGDLIDLLEQPDPRLPVTEKRDGKEVTMVRELVKVNHHRNCLLCHAPGNTENTPAGVLKVAVPSPTEPLPKPSDGGGYQTMPSTPDILVRIDMTYLRQDFSLLMPVADAHPWPELQRFDFLVRKRPLTPADVQAYEARREADEPGRPSVYHRAALYALRELSGRDVEPTPQAWRKLLNLAKKS